MRRILYRDGTDGLGSVGLLILRATVGMAFIFHGWGKIQQPTSWMGEGAPVPGPLQAAAAVSEFGGGIGLVLGLLTPLACLGIAGTMSFAIVMVHLRAGHAFVSLSNPPGPSWELAGVYLAGVILPLLIGPGRISLDAVLLGRRSQPTVTPTP